MVEDGRGRRAGRPAQISRDKIIEVVSSVENLDTLTMRELATRLGVRHGALYRWVKNRDELYDLVSEVLVDRIRTEIDAYDQAGSTLTGCRTRLRRIAGAIHDHFLALPGYATHLSRPHRHHRRSFERLRAPVVEAFVEAGVGDDLALASWQIFITCLMSRLAADENPLDLGPGTPSFDAFLDVLLRGLPVRPPHERDT